MGMNAVQVLQDIPYAGSPRPSVVGRCGSVFNADELDLQVQGDCKLNRVNRGIIE